jgi:hypothetical protein
MFENKKVFIPLVFLVLLCLTQAPLQRAYYRFFERDRILASVPAQNQKAFVPIDIEEAPRKFDLAWAEYKEGIVVENYVSEFGERIPEKYSPVSRKHFKRFQKLSGSFPKKLPSARPVHRTKPV